MASHEGACAASRRLGGLRLRGESVMARFVSIPPNGFTDQTVLLEQELPLTGKIRRVFGKGW
jgi:hypothetical protein